MATIRTSSDLVGRLTPYADRIVLFGSLANLGPVVRYLGRAELLAGRIDDAERHLRQAVAVAAKHGLRPSLAHASLHLAELLHRRGDTDARDHLNRAATLAHDLDLRAVKAGIGRADPGSAAVR